MSRKTEAGLACTIGIDPGKNTLHLVGLDAKGAVVLREKLARGRIAARLANVPPCLIGIEAGMATLYVARELLVLGHDVRQVPPAYAKPLASDSEACRQLMTVPGIGPIIARRSGPLLPQDLNDLVEIRRSLGSERQKQQTCDLVQPPGGHWVGKRPAGFLSCFAYEPACAVEKISSPTCRFTPASFVVLAGH